MKKLMNYLLFSVLFSFIFCITIFAEPKVGDVVGNIYSTDIMAYVDGVPIQSYNIGGKTVVCIEDLGNIDTQDNQNKQFGYSKYAMNFVWDGVNRAVSLNTFKSNLYELERLCIQNNIIIPPNSSIYNLHFKYLDAENYEFFPLFSLDEDECKNQITEHYSVQLNGKEIKSDVPLVKRIHIDDTFGDSIILNYNINELEKIFKKENLENPFIAPSKEDIAKTIKNEAYKKVFNEVTIDDCIYLLCYFYGTISSYCELIEIDNNANIHIYVNAATHYDEQLNYQKVYYTDIQVRTNKNDYIVKSENEKVNLYCLNFDAKEIKQIYSDYGIQVLEYFPDNSSQTDIIKIQNNEGETIELKLSESLN